jgi:hypothetical protein
MAEQDPPIESIPTVRERLSSVLPADRIELHMAAGLFRIGPNCEQVTDLDQPAPRHLAITIAGR